MSDHDAWEELAAGYALDALEPGDEHAFAEHLRGCDRCRRDLAGLREAAGQLAYAADPVLPPPELGERIMAAAAAERPEAFHPGTPRHVEPAPRAPRRPHRTHRVAPRTWQPAAFAAAAVLVVFALGVWNVVLREDVRTQRDATARRTAALACFATPDAATFRMSAPDGQQRATACLTGTEAYVVADHLTPNPTRDVYVLWWLDAAKAPHAVERFDVATTTPAVFALPLAVRPADVHGMAVSLEPGRALPEKPTHPVVSAQVA